VFEVEDFGENLSAETRAKEQELRQASAQLRQN
jgi:hypothetical protein